MLHSFRVHRRWLSISLRLLRVHVYVREHTCRDDVLWYHLSPYDPTTACSPCFYVRFCSSLVCSFVWVLDSTCEWQLGLGRSCSLGVEELSAWNAELDQDREHWKMTLGKHVTLIHLLPVKKRKCTLQGKKKKLWLAVTWLNRLCYEAEIFIDY